MILGITGTNGAGKGAVVDYLVREKGFTHYSVREEITDELKRRGLGLNRDNTREVGTDLRRMHGAAYFTDTFMARAAAAGIPDFIMESIRSVAEAENIHAHKGFIIAVDAPRELRYERIISRATSTDAVSFERFCLEEDREMVPEDPNDPTQMNMRGVMERADCTLINDGSLDELHAKIEVMLKALQSR